MLRLKGLLSITALCLLALAASCIATAQNVVFTAIAGANKIGIEDRVQIQFTIQDVKDLQTLDPVGLRSTKDFTVVGGPYQSRGSNISLVNGKMTQSSSVSLTYDIQPTKTGTFTIAPAVAKDGSGHSYQSNSITIQVIPGSVAAQQKKQNSFDPFNDEWDPFASLHRKQQAMRQPQAQQQQPAINEDISKNIFIRVTVDKNSVHVGEQITASYKLYSRLPMNVQISKLPSLNGFWTQDFELARGNIKPTEETIDGKKYQVFTLKKSALFPQQTGNLQLDPAEAEGIVRLPRQVKQQNPYGDDPFSLFGSFMMSDPFFNGDFFNMFGYQDIKVNLKSTPVKITVTPLPEENKPADFGNAVGKFTITAHLDKTELTTDDVANFKLTINGTGNLKLIEAPKMNLPNGLDSYDPLVTDTITGRSTTISGSKVINYPIAPNIPGDYTIPAIQFSYYDAQAGKYVTLETPAQKIHVKRGKGYKQRTAQKIAAGDIHNISTKPLKEFNFQSKPLFFKTGYWSLYALPLVLFAGALAWKRREDSLAKDSILLRSKRANKVALKRLTTARKLLQENKKQPFYDEISKAIWLYLSDKLSIPLSSLSRERAREAFAQKQVPYDLQLNVEHIIEECEVALYAGMSDNRQMTRAYGEAVDIISKLEESL
jgi:hypothetical protein